MSRWLAGLEERATAALPPTVAQYVGCGSCGNVTRDEAAASWSSRRLLPHVLREVTQVDLEVDVLGRSSPVPWAWAPTSLQRAIHPDGELAVARASAEAGVLMVVSSNAGTPFADIGATGVRWWLQAYLPQDRSLAAPLLERAVAAGAEAVVLTVDTPVVATKDYGPPDIWEVVDSAMVRVNFDPGYEVRPGSHKATDLGPADVALLAEESGIPVVVKGVLRPDDALAAVDAGAAAVWVSNHGGRQLDRVVPTARALPLVAEAVDGAVPVYVDGGLRSGLDIVTALGLGADLTFLGRPVSWALIDGGDGITRLHRDLYDEVVEAMRLAGCSGVPATRGIVADPEHHV